MAEIVTCPSCQRRLTVPGELAGQAVKCPTCAATFTASAPGSVPPPPPPPELPTVDYTPSPDEELESRMRRDMLPHRGTLVLVFGILSLVVFFPSLCCGFLTLGGLGFGITAWVLGRGDLLAMQRHEMDPDGMGITRAGWVCGLIGTIASSLMLLVQVAFVVLSILSDL
jgi:hypothetical protein